MSQITINRRSILLIGDGRQPLYYLSVLGAAWSPPPTFVLAFGDRRNDSIAAINGKLATASRKTMAIDMPIVTSEMRMATQANSSSLSVPEGTHWKCCPGAIAGQI